ncbi:MAG: guanine deaminase [Chthoniobacterales bacterium]|nr:MAG: guanine deaminase [Chthoniobacterales bacterium]
MNSNLVGLRGFVIDAPDFGTLRSDPDGAVVFQNGKILARGNFDKVRALIAEPIQWREESGLAILPGLIDCHTHLPQYPAVARGESELMPWLRDVIFPLERAFTAERAQEEAPRFFQELARNGTTMAAIFTAIYEESCDAVFTAAEASGLRAIIGKMMMDIGSYGQLQPTEVLAVSLEESERLCRKWNGADDGRIDYAFSPRFAVTCSEPMMRRAAELATKFNAYLQTHLAENQTEITTVWELFPDADDYTGVYEHCGMLGSRTILGHCLHLSAREIRAIAAGGASVAHCPTSNLFLGSGLFKLEQFTEAGIPVGLGSDVAAGPELNIWQVMRAAIEVQKARACYERGERGLRPAEAFYLGTHGGARALGKSNTIGTLEVGRDADVTVVDLARVRPYHEHATGELSAEDVIALCIYRARPESTVATYVRGRCIYERNSHQSYE